ncbi:F-box/LRR-repeat protein At2g43260-like [Lolium perenne]|uniref:F-box/LRR-repeat protein At2g43260-like n=1 Tax=Lolium perenne TaxID=4522 RepID=UPI0021F50FBE|nr:uncharacterized protein LOC127322110 [Lolium perenne]
MESKPSSSWSPPRKRARARLVAPDQGNDGYILPTNELQEVLLRLPSKCLGRLRAVCQSWRYMLSDPLFVAAHASRSNADSILVVADHSPDRQLVDLIFLDVATGAVLQRMDGLARRRGELLCFVGPGPGGGAVQVLGPATDDTTDVVATSTEPYDRASFTASFYLVGHVPATAGEHKVLHVTDVRGEQSCEVFSIGAGRRQSHQRWRPTQGPPPFRVDWIARSRAVVNGVAYFLPTAYQDLNHYDSVAAFYLETEQWRPTPIRGPVCNRKQSVCLLLFCFSLAELDGHLVMVHHNWRVRTMDIYSLTTDTEKGGWSRTLSLRLNWVVNRRCEHFAEPLAVLDDGRIVVFVPGTKRGVVRVYDPRTETRTEVMLMSRHCTVVGLYRGSLLSFRVLPQSREIVKI